jgi:hypothetical protein
MSPPPTPDYSNLPVPSQRPKALTVVSIIGIVLASIGVMCVCAGLAGVLIGGEQQQQQFAHESMRDLILQISTSVAGVCISLFMLIACIGALGLRPWSAMMMIVVNVINLIFESFKLVVGLIYGIPKSLQQMQNPPPETPAQSVEMLHKFFPYMKVGIYVATVLVFLIQVVYSLSVLRVMKRADVKAALADPNDSEQTPMM